MVEVLTAGNIEYSIWSKERIEIDDTQPEKAIKHIEKKKIQTNISMD